MKKNLILSFGLITLIGFGCNRADLFSTNSSDAKKALGDISGLTCQQLTQKSEAAYRVLYAPGISKADQALENEKIRIIQEQFQTNKCK